MLIEEDTPGIEAIDEGSDVTSADTIGDVPTFEPQLDLHSGLPGIGHHGIGGLCYIVDVLCYM
jgi:hypothetical protein